MLQNTPFYILSRHWADTNDGIQLRIWLLAEGRSRCWTIDNQESTCFIAESFLHRWQAVWRRLNINVRVGGKQFTALMGDTVIPVYTSSFIQQRRWTKQGREQGLKVWEDDVNPVDRYLMERFLFGSLIFSHDSPKPALSEPALKVLSIDIETSWYEPGKTPELYSVALAGDDLNVIYIVAQKPSTDNSETPNIRWCSDVKECLVAVIETILNFDPDCIVGWNVIDFDLRILQNHCDHHGLAFAIGRQGQIPRWRARGDNADRFNIEVEGRLVVDGPGAFRSAAWAFEDYTLETVSRSLLQRGKKIAQSDDRVNEIERMYREEPIALASYNLEDARLVLDLFDIAGLWHFLIERSHLTGLPMDKPGASSAAFNTVYMPRLHRKGYVASSVGEQTLQLASPGGFVMDSIPGIYEDVLVLDFKSLYPSIIRTFLIDPLGLQEGLKQSEKETVPGFLDARFHRDNHILPALIDQLWQARDQAKKEKNAPLSQAIKIIMNSFYGVLGSPLCRFFDPRLASSITMRGHDILQKSREFIEAQGYQVIYGDTDSVFVHVYGHQAPDRLGTELANALNLWWRDTIQKEFNLECHLEMEFEIHYEKFVMPTIRGSETGSKKRYAGWTRVENESLMVFKGLEAVRSDWTPLAKRFQTQLYEKHFRREDYKAFIVKTVQDLQNGLLDEQLVYSRRLRRKIEQYEKQAPPQVQAARLKQQINPHWQGRNIEYVKTTQGWQPIPFASAPFDYQHYITKQLEPIADALLHFFGESFAELIDEQLSLF